MNSKTKSKSDWLGSWLDGVASGESTMSQRTLTSVEKHGGLREARKVARARKVHLVLLTDDQGTSLLAASKHPCKTIC